MLNGLGRTGRRDFLMGTGALAASAMLGAPASHAAAPKSLKAIYPTRSSSSWSLFIAKEAGLYAKHGLDVGMQFGVHPLAMAGLLANDVQFTNYAVDDVAAAAVRDPSAFVIVATTLSKAMFALMTKPNVADVKGLKGKRVICGRVGDAPYHYTVGIFKEFGMAAGDVQWIPTGTDANARAQMLLAGQADAALLTAPSYYRVEEKGLKVLTTVADHASVVIYTGVTLKRSWVQQNPDVPERIIKAQAEAVKLFYDDKATAVSIYRKYDKAASVEEAGRLYDAVARISAIDRIPLMSRDAVAASVDRISADVPAAKTFDFRQTFDMSVVRRLIDEGYFEKLFGASVKAEQERRLKESFA